LPASLRGLLENPPVRYDIYPKENEILRNMSKDIEEQEKEKEAVENNEENEIDDDIEIIDYHVSEEEIVKFASEIG
jgi:hypothetical protein